MHMFNSFSKGYVLLLIQESFKKQLNNDLFQNVIQSIISCNNYACIKYKKNISNSSKLYYLRYLLTLMSSNFLSTIFRE